MKANNINENKYINLKYCYDTGKLFWKVQVAIRSKAGSLAGTKTNNGYIILKLNGINIQAHRVVYELHHGEQDWAAYEIDHINGIRHDNRISNLRLVDRLENMKNKKKYKSNRSGHVGVYWNKSLSKWQGQVRVNTKPIYLGVFDSKQDCINAVESKRKELKFHVNHGRNK